MSDPTALARRPERAHGTELLLRGARRPQPPGAHDLQRLGAAVDEISRAPVRGQVSWLRLGGGGRVRVRDRRRRHVRLGAARARHEAPGRDGRGGGRAARATPRARASRALERGAERGAGAGPADARALPPPRRASRRSRVGRARAAPVVVETAKPTDSLAREVPLIDEGRADLATAPSRALAVLETHRREFPHGQLAAEREFLAVQALLQMNRMADAKKRAEDLAVHYPSSSYAARAARLIEDAEAQRAAVPAKDGSRGSAPPGLQRVQDRL